MLGSIAGRLRPAPWHLPFPAPAGRLLRAFLVASENNVRQEPSFKPSAAPLPAPFAAFRLASASRWPSAGRLPKAFNF